MQKKGKQFSSRLWRPYDELVIEKAREARITPNQLVRIAIMAFVDMEFMSMHDRLSRIEESLAALRAEFQSLES